MLRRRKRARGETRISQDGCVPVHPISRFSQRGAASPHPRLLHCVVSIVGSQLFLDSAVWKCGGGFSGLECAGRKVAHGEVFSCGPRWRPRPGAGSMVVIIQGPVLSPHPVPTWRACCIEGTPGPTVVAEGAQGRKWGADRGDVAALAAGIVPSLEG